MSGNKRIPKRSIIGSRVAGRCTDEVWRPGLVTAMCAVKEKINGSKRFSVRLEDGGQVLEFLEGELVGPGFLSSIPSKTMLPSGQSVFLTNHGREVEGKVTRHWADKDLVEVDAKGVGPVAKKLEEVRLMESRKSARLINTDTDFSRLADFNIVEQRKLLTEKPSRRRLHSMSDFHDRKMKLKSDVERKEKRRQRSERCSLKTGSMEVPSILSSQSRKRRTSESRAEIDSGYGSSYGSSFIRTVGLGNDENLKECTAAMVLMNLCTGPRDSFWRQQPHSNISPSPGFTSSDASSPTTPRPSPATSLSHLHLDEDEEPTKRAKPNNHVIYQCTWRGCNQQELCQEQIERHVRHHLGLPEPGPDTIPDFEEEFYYTELEYGEEDSLMDCIEETVWQADLENSVASVSQSINIVKPSTDVQQQDFVSILPKFHIPPPKERQPSLLASSAPSTLTWCNDQISIPHPLGDHIGMVRPSYEAPTTIYVVNSGSGIQAEVLGTSLPSIKLAGKKFVSIIPKPDGGDWGEQRVGLNKTQGPNKSPVGLKSDKKCRKVYGIDQKDLWCTQCKWKKACGRFS